MDRADLDRWKPREVARLLALVESERRYYQEIVAFLPVGLAVVSNGLWLVSANRSFRQAFSVKTDEIGKKRLNEILRVDDLNERILDVLTTGAPQHNILYSPPGEAAPRFFRISVLPLRSWEDEMELEALLVFEDLTGVESAAAPQGPPEVAKPVLMPPQQEPVRTAEWLERLEAMVWECDPNLHVLDLSPYAETMLGYPVSHWLSGAVSWEERVHPDDRAFVSSLFRDAMEQRSRLHLEYRAKTADDRTLWVRESVRIERDPQGKAQRLWGVTIDITENRRLAERVVLTHKMDSLSRLTSRVAHQYNNFLMVISSYGDDLMELLPPESPLRADVEQILNAAQKVSTLTNKLLAFSRRPVARPERVDFTELVTTAIQPVVAALPDGIELVRMLPPDVGLIEVDPGQVTQALGDLAAVAVKAARCGRVTVEITRIDPMHSAEMETRPGSVCLSITAANWETDTETRRRLFEPDFLNAAETPALSDAYWLLRQNHAEILLSGESGHGTTITVLFPALGGVMRTASVPPTPAGDRSASPSKVIPLPVEERTSTRSEAHPAEKQAAPGAPGRAVLVVDDEEAVRNLISKILLRHGFEVLEASSPEEALETFGAHSARIGLLVTDMVMEGLSGRELAERLRAQAPALKVLYVSGYTEDAAIHSGLLPPGTAFLQKPFTLSAFLEKVHEIMEKDGGGA